MRSLRPAGDRNMGWREAGLASPECGVAPGQSAVFYDGERLLGGGTIVSTEAAGAGRREPSGGSLTGWTRRRNGQSAVR